MISKEQYNILLCRYLGSYRYISYTVFPFDGENISFLENKKELYSNMPQNCSFDSLPLLLFYS